MQGDEVNPSIRTPARNTATSARTTARGRPARRVFINVSVRESTRKAMNSMTRRLGMTQGELLDQLMVGKLRVK
jgi:hypothetical protein